jgi:hypothetical protein
MFGLFRRTKEVKEHYIGLVQLFHMVKYSWTAYGKDFAFRILQNEEIVTHSSVNKEIHGPSCYFRLKLPMNEFSGVLSDDGQFGAYLRVEGLGKYAGFGAQQNLDSEQIVVSAKDGIRHKVTWRALLLKTEFAADGALDTSTW